MSEQMDIRFALVGNRPALDFANTVHARRQNVDALRSLSDLLDLAETLALLPRDVLERYRLRSKEDAASSQAVLEQARAFRAQLRQWLETAPAPPPAGHPLVDAINAILGMGTSREMLADDGHGWRLVQAPLDESLTLALVPFARSAAQLIAEGASAPIRKCGNPRCPLYFYDTSRNGKRRWCSMESCGNQAKARAHLDRKSHTHAAE